MTAVWDYSQAPNMTALMVALVLADHADHDGEVHMTLAAVAQQARVSRTTVYESIRTLKFLGELVTVEQGGSGPGTANIYRLTVVDNLPVRVREPNPSNGSKRVQKGFSLLNTKPNSLTTNKAPASVPEPEPLPPPVDKAKLAANMADIRARLPKGKRRR
jgi:hypothetical protein